MNYELPKKVTVCNQEYEIRSDFRAILDIICALNDPELDDQERAYVVLDIFYPAFSGKTDLMPPEYYQEALNTCFKFISYDDNNTNGNAKLMDWEQDFRYVIAAVNKVIGQEIRSMDYLHWWTFLDAYSEIGECLFSQIVSIRYKKTYNKKMDKSEQEWYRHNRNIVDIKTKYTADDQRVFEKWGV